MTVISRLSIACLTLTLMACGRTNVATSNTLAQLGPQTNATAQSSTDATGLTIPNFTFQMATHQAFTVTLPGHATEGYDWHLNSGYDNGVVALVGAERYGTLPTTPAMGVSAPVIFDITAGSAGKTSLHFSLYRPWESATTATDTRVFNVVVK